MGSPTQRSLKRLRDMGYEAQVVERWVPGANKRVDLFGFGDILAIGPRNAARSGGRDVLIVQTTSYSNASARVRKIKESPVAPVIREAGIRIEVHGWRKVSGRWQPRVIDLS